MNWNTKQFSIGVFLLIIGVAALLFLTGCATKYNYRSGDTEFSVKSYREFKNIEVDYQDLHLRAEGVTDDTAETLTTLTGMLRTNAMSTGDVVLKGGPLCDMQGNPRNATAAEVAAQYNALSRRIQNE